MGIFKNQLFMVTQLADDLVIELIGSETVVQVRSYPGPNASFVAPVRGASAVKAARALGCDTPVKKTVEEWRMGMRSGDAAFVPEYDADPSKARRWFLVGS